MIYSTEFGGDREVSHWVQKNNSIEAILAKMMGKEVFESCGPTAMRACLAAVGYVDGLVEGVQDEDIITLFLNNPANYTALRNVRSNLDPERIMGNRVPQYYSYACDRLFGADVGFFMGKVGSRTVEALKGYKAVQLCFDSPGHYVACVGFDSGTDEIIYNDPMGGFNLRFHVDGFDRFRNWGNVVYPK